MSFTQDQDFLVVKPYIIQNFQQYRILQPKMIFLHGLSERLSNHQELNYHLSNYGSIVSTSFQFISRNFYSAFVEFKSEVGASLAVTALDNFNIDKRSLRVSFASTKFCPHFLRDSPCLVDHCNYAHYYIGQLAHLKDFAKQINHKNIAINNLWQNYEQVLLLLCRFEDNQSIFPSTSTKLKELFMEKSQQFFQYQQRIRNCLKILESRRKINKNKKIFNDQQSNVDADASDEWSDIDDSISDFLEEEIEKPKSCKSHSSRILKTKIQLFLDEAEQNLMNLIFKSSLAY